MCKLDEAIDKLENGNGDTDFLEALELLAEEVYDIKEICNGRSPVCTRS